MGRSYRLWGNWPGAIAAASAMGARVIAIDIDVASGTLPWNAVRNVFLIRSN